MSWLRVEDEDDLAAGDMTRVVQDGPGLSHLEVYEPDMEEWEADEPGTVGGGGMSNYVYDDGGRSAAGFKGEAGDCVVRALTIANGEDYRVVYSELGYLMRCESRKARGKTRGKTTPRDGVPLAIVRAWLDHRGWRWTPTMRIGSGCTTHLRADELPTGRVIVRLTRHVAAVIDGVLHDTHDCSRDGTRCVYGYWTPGGAA